MIAVTLRFITGWTISCRYCKQDNDEFRRLVFFYGCCRGCSPVSSRLNVSASGPGCPDLQPCETSDVKTLFCTEGAPPGRASRFVKQDSNMHPGDGANVNSSTWHRIRSGVQDALAHLKTVPCDECLRAIHWWNRRIWLVNRERCVHLHCWKGQLLLKALVADHIEYIQVMADENSALSRNHSPENELQERPTCAAQREQVEQPIILLKSADELVAKADDDETQRDSNSFLRKSGESPRHFLSRLVPHRSPPRPPRLCMLCGAVEFSEKSMFCSKCGTSLRTSS
jgi:hypothetical protein